MSALTGSRADARAGDAAPSTTAGAALVVIALLDDRENISNAPAKQRAHYRAAKRNKRSKTSAE